MENIGFALGVVEIQNMEWIVNWPRPDTVEPWYNEPPYNEVLGITNDLVYPSNSKIYGKVPRYNETSL